MAESLCCSPKTITATPQYKISLKKKKYGWCSQILEWAQGVLTASWMWWPLKGPTAVRDSQSTTRALPLLSATREHLRRSKNPVQPKNELI